MLIRELLDLFFPEDYDKHYIDYEDAIALHLHLRLLIEELLSDDCFAAIREYYFCSFESLHELDAYSHMNWLKPQRGQVNKFHSKIAALHVRAGSPDPPKAEPYGPLVKELRRVFGICRKYDAPAPPITVAKIRADFEKITTRETQQTANIKSSSPQSTAPHGGEATDEELHQHHDTIWIPGTVTGQGNVIFVNGIETTLTDVQLALLLRLILGLKVKKDSWVTAKELEKDGAIKYAGYYTPYYTLRKVLQDKLWDKDAKKFIENDPIHKGRYRIAVPPGCVGYSKAQLLKHPTSEKIRELAERVPRSRKPKK